MSLPHSSVSTIKDVEFVNLEPSDISPLISKCEIKVMYVGQNRNHSFITKEVATEMSKTLRGNPIVGAYREEKQDFSDHGEQIIIDGEGIKFKCLTKPYGFVSPDAKVWFKEFEDTDEFGNKIIREYLMTTGYLWTEQYEEAKSILEQGKPHSMELDNKTIDGKWATDSKSGIDFFIINDAIFSKLCVLGDDIEPCFEGSSVTAPDISTTFAVDNNFRQSLYTMMQQLKFALEGGQEMQTTTQETSTVTTTTQGEAVVTDFEKKEEEKKEEKKEGGEEKKEDEKDKEKNKYALLEEQLSQLETRYAALEKEYQNLVSFKKDVEDKEKDEMINSFYMLSDEDKKDVIENKVNYSLNDIKSKLAVICFEKKVNFNLDNNDKNDNTVVKEEPPATTFNLNNGGGESVPAWIAAAMHKRDSRNNY